MASPTLQRREDPRPVPKAQTLGALEFEFIDMFVRLSRALGQPGSFGQIYGFIFISRQPQTMEDIEARLQISKGSASQGLKFLREIGAVRPVEVPGHRRVHYEAVAELRKLAGNFLREKIQPQLSISEERLDRLARLAQSSPAAQRDHALRRIATLRTWSRNSRQVLPLLLRVLGG